MAATLLRLLLASTFALAALPETASAQFGLPMPRVGRLPLPLPGPGRHLRVLPGVHFGKFRRTFGVIGAVAVGSVILGRLSRRDGTEVTRRTRVMLDREPNTEVSDVYQTTDGNKQVVISAGPAQKPSEFKGDPALQQTSDFVGSAGTASAGKGKATAKAENDVIKIDQLAQDSQCRKVTTEMEVKGGKKASSAGDAKTTNVAILCQTAGEWKPVSM